MFLKKEFEILIVVEFLWLYRRFLELAKVSCKFERL